MLGNCVDMFRLGKSQDSNKEEEEEESMRCVEYCGRQCLAAPSTGNKVKHLREYEKVLTDAFGELTEENKARLKMIEEEAAAAVKEAAAKKAAEEAKKSPQKPPTGGSTPPAAGGAAPTDPKKK